MLPSTLSESREAVSEKARAGTLTGASLAQAVASLSDTTAIDLAGATLDGADLSGLSLFKVNLAGASLREATLDGADLTGADLRGAVLDRASLVGAGLGMAKLDDAAAFEANFTGATLSGAVLSRANLGCAVLKDARMREAELIGTELHGADLRNAELSEADVSEARFDEADMRGASLRSVTGYQSAGWYGTDLRDVNFAGAYMLRRHVIDENYLREFRESGPIHQVLYDVWRLTSDCGRSLSRWALVITVVALVFAVAFALVGVQTGIHPPGALTSLYYSVVTITTLGYGDIVPNTGVGRVLVMLEVCIGYMLLGGLISIFANKMARRGD